MRKFINFILNVCLYVGGFIAFEYYVSDGLEDFFIKPDNTYVPKAQENTSTTAHSKKKSHSKTNTYGGFPNITSNSRDIGTARSVKHNLYVLTLYVTQDKDPITPKEKQYYKESLCIAKDWFVETAALYGIDFKLGRYNVRNKNGGEFHIDDSYDIDKMEPRTIAKMYYGQNYLSRIRELAQEAGYNDYIFVVCCKNNCNICRAYKCDESRSNCSEYLEGCIINLNIKSELPTVIAHEILHTLGAWDLYVSEERDYNVYKGAGAKYKDRLSNSIMTNTNRNINSAEMDDLTAYLVSLTDTKYGWFDIIAENGGY